MNTDLSALYCSIKELLGYRSKDMLGESLYEFHHALDSEQLEKSYKNCKCMFVAMFELVSGRYLIVDQITEITGSILHMSI